MFTNNDSTDTVIHDIRLPVLNKHYSLSMSRLIMTMARAGPVIPDNEFHRDEIRE